MTDRLAKNNTLLVAVQDPLEPLDPSALFFDHRKRVIKGTLKYHDSRPGGLPGRMVGPLVEGGDPWVWTPEWGQSMTTAGIVGPVTLERTGDASLDALFVTPLGETHGAGGGGGDQPHRRRHRVAPRPRSGRRARAARRDASRPGPGVSTW